MWIATAVLLIAQAGQALAVPDRCIYLVTTENGWLRYTDNTVLNKVGGGVIFYCDDGFELVGQTSTECQADGTWKDPVPKCVDRRCSIIIGLQDGTVTDYCNNPDCNPKFQCDQDWKLNGPADIKCVNGDWSDTVPTCIPNWCPLMTTFMHGNVLGYRNPPIVGTTVTVKCANGFKLQGNGKATCQPNLEWSADLGTCECDDPKLCRKAKFNCPHVISTPFSQHKGDGVAPGSWIVLTGCNTGYGFPLGGGRNSKCVNGKFSFIPQCSYTRCPHIENIKGGTVTNTVKYAMHDTVQFKCNDRFKRIGPPGMQCRGTKMWGPGSGTVTCQEMVCPDILTFDHGIVKDYDNVLNHVIKFECDPGYKLVGWKGIRCTCKPGETPSWQTDPPKCVLKTGECTAYGDPHFRTLDNQRIDFMGACKMVLTGTCDRTNKEVESKNLTNFHVESSSFKKSPDSLVSYTKFVTVDIYDWRIQLGPGVEVIIGKIQIQKDGTRTMIDGIKRELPVRHLEGAPGVKVGMIGRFVVLTTEFGLTVKLDEFFKVVVSVPATYLGVNLCGICGNFNGNPEDDLVTKEGKKIGFDEVKRKDGTTRIRWHFHDIGNSWEVPSEFSKPGCKAFETPDLECESLAATLDVEKKCSLITNKKGVFSKCLAVVDEAAAQDHENNCVFDACSSKPSRAELICNVMADFADMCAGEGVSVVWRQPDFCPLVCGEHEKYTPNMPTCTKSCEDPNPKPEECKAGGVAMSDVTDEGCVCVEGFTLSNDQCVPKDQCGCVDPDGNYYEKGETFINEDCTMETTCLGDNKFKQTDLPGCHPKAKCMIKDGETGCFCKRGFAGDGVSSCIRIAALGTKKAMCVAAGDPFYTTFDGGRLEFQGSCDYLLATPCDSDDWSVTSRNMATYRDGGRRAFVGHIVIQVGAHEIILRQFGKAEVDSIELTLPQDGSAIPLENGEVEIRRVGPQVVLTTEFGLKLEYDGRGPSGRHRANITVADSFLMGNLCGLCGNWNNKMEDDFRPKNSDKTGTHLEIGKSWRVGGVPDCVE